MNNATLDFSFIRPSDNSISGKEFKKMMNIGDEVQEKEEKKIPQLEFISDNVAFYIFTLGSKFRSKAAPNDDLPKVTSILKKSE